MSGDETCDMCVDAEKRAARGPSHHRGNEGAVSGDVTAAMKQLRAVASRTSPDQRKAVLNMALLLADEVERLRAEREALVTTIRARADEVAPEVNFEETNDAASEERTLAWVLSVLTADPEADQ